MLGDSAILSLTIDEKGRRPSPASGASVHVDGPGVPVPDPAHGSLKIMRSVSREDFGRRAIRATSEGRLLVGKG